MSWFLKTNKNENFGNIPSDSPIIKSDNLSCSDILKELPSSANYLPLLYVRENVSLRRIHVHCSYVRAVRDLESMCSSVTIYFQQQNLTRMYIVQ
jgi:hypothetical protein